jgi:hypothetical protein
LFFRTIAPHVADSKEFGLKDSTKALLLLRCNTKYLNRLLHNYFIKKARCVGIGVMVFSHGGAVAPQNALLAEKIVSRIICSTEVV